MATYKRTRGIHQFEANFDSSILTNDGGIILVDLTIHKWVSTKGAGGFMLGAYHFAFNIHEEMTNKLRTRLLLGLPVHITVACEYSKW